jgi:hypothetical protein
LREEHARWRDQLLDGIRTSSQGRSLQRAPGAGGLLGLETGTRSAQVAQTESEAPPMRTTVYRASGAPTRQGLSTYAANTVCAARTLKLCSATSKWSPEGQLDRAATRNCASKAPVHGGVIPWRVQLFPGEGAEIEARVAAMQAVQTNEPREEASSIHTAGANDADAMSDGTKGASRPISAAQLPTRKSA